MNRLHIILLIALLTLAGSLTAAVATAQERDFRLRGYVNPAQSLDLPFRIPRFGVNAELTQYTSAELAANLDLMREINVFWVRQFVRWEEIESSQGEYDWSAWDTFAQAFNEADDLELVAVLFGAPAWARDSSAVEQPTAPPADPAAFASFARVFAERYGNIINVYQIWDEPNLATAWGNLEPQAADYAAMVLESSQAIHAGDPGSTVLAAALAPTTETGRRNISDILYLQALYALDLDNYVDGFAAKPYGFNLPPEDRTVENGVLNFSRVVALRDIMLANGDGTSPLWISAFGWNSLPANWVGNNSIWGQVSAQEQSSFVASAIDRAEQEWAWLGGMLTFHWQPDAPPDDAVWGFALIDSLNRPTSLYESLAAYQTPYAATNGLFSAVNPYAEYSGVWTFGSAGADIGWVQDSGFAFQFHGRNVSLLLRQGNYEAYLYPTIDNDLVNALPHDADGRPFINLKSDDLLPQLELVPVSRGLSYGSHRLQAVADRGWDQWALVGFGVSDGDLAQPYNQQVTVALISSLIAGLSAIVVTLQIDWSPTKQAFRSLWNRLGDAGQIAASAITSIALLIGMLLTWGDSTPALFRREPVQLGLALASAGLIYLEPGFVLSILGGLVLFVLIFQRLELGLILSIFFAPFFLFPVELYQFSFPMSELIILITMFAGTLRALSWWGHSRQATVHHLRTPTLRERLKQLSTLDWVMLTWGVLGVISLAWTQYRAEALTELRTMIIEPIAFYIILRAIKPDRATLLRLVDALLIAGAVVAAYGLISYVQGIGVITAENGTARLASVYGSPNNVGLLLGRCIPFALAFTMLRVDAMRRRIAFIIFCLAGMAVILTQSAGAWFVGIPAGVIAVLLMIGGKRGRIAIFTLLLFGIALALLATQSARFSRLLDLSDGTNFFRIRVWQSAVQIIEDHPLTGIGLDQFLYAFRGRYMLPDAWQEPNLSHPHNFILDWWTRLGILGVIVFGWIQSAFWKRGLNQYQAARSRDPLTFALIVGCLGSMVNLLAHGLVDNSVYVNDLALIFALLLGIAACLRTSELLTNPPI